MSDEQIELLLSHDASTSCRVLAFPLNRQVGKIRDVARKLSRKRTARHAKYYKIQVSDALSRKLTLLDIVGNEREMLIAAFWSAVEREMTRLSGLHSIA